MALIRKQNHTLLVGLFAALALGCFVVLLMIMSARGPSLKDGYELTLFLEDGSGAIKGAQVRMGGAIVGEVGSDPVLREDYTGVDLRLKIQEGVKIPARSRFSLSGSGILGENYILISPPPLGERSGEFLPAEAAVIGDRGGVDLEEISQSALSLMAETEQTVVELRERLEEVETTTSNINASSGNLESTLQRLDEQFLSEENALAWSQTLANAQRLTASLATTSESLAQASERLPSILDQVEGTLAEANAAASNIAEVSDQAGDLVAEAEGSMEEFTQSLASASEAMDELSVTLNLVREGDGLVPGLLTDAQLRQDFHDLIFNLRESGLIFYDSDEADERRQEEQGRGRLWPRSSPTDQAQVLEAIPIDEAAAAEAERKRKEAWQRRIRNRRR